SLQESMRVGHAMTRELERIPGVRLVGQRAGRAAEMVDPTGVNNSEIEVELKPMSGAEQTRVLDRIREVIAGYPGLTTSVNTVLTERIDETISGFTAPVIVNLYGNDLDLLDGQAQQVAQVRASVPGATGVAVQSPPGTLRLSVRLRPERLAQYGFAPVEVMDAVRTAFQGVRAAQVYDGSRVRDVTVILAPDDRRSPADVGRLPMSNAQGVTVPLSRLATIEQVAGRYQIRHSAGQRVQTVTCGVRGRGIGDFVRDAQQRIRAGVEFPRGTYFTMSGEAQAQARSQQELLVNTALAVAGIGLLLFMALRTARGALLVLFNLPFALVGGVAAALLTGGTLSLGSLIGFVTLFGITLRNAIMLVSHYEHLIEREGCEWGPETALRGASERLVPILMTALVTALGLLPLAWNNGEPGNEIEGPMAIVILGGLVTSTLLNLLILPALSLRFGRFGARREDPFAGVAGG
ncbi:MAG: efflux RND transporter permease subunit, partial [Burkholderiaceae bacterium]